MYSTKIKSIKKLGEIETYDLHTPEYHNFFINNGILTHNSGKSWSCIKMCEIYSEMFDIPFNPEFHVISSLKELLMLITSKDADKKIQYRSVLLFDEPQVEGNSTAWQSEINQALRQLISTFRNQRLVIFFALPFIEMLDKQSRILFHGEFKVTGFDENTGVTTIKPRFIEYIRKADDFYRKRLIIQYKSPDKNIMNTTKLNLWHIGRATQHNIDVYEGKKKAFTDNLNKKLLDQILLSEKQTEGRNKSEELFKIKELYEQYGENYLLILEKMPHLTPYVVKDYINFIKKSINIEGKATRLT